NAKPFKEKFSELEIENHFIFFKGNTRINYKIKNLSAQEETEFNGLGTEVPKELVTHLLSYLDNNLKPGDILVASGSVPNGVDIDIYKKIGELCHKKDAKYILDTSKNALKYGIESKPYLIKQNIEEMTQVLGNEYQQKEYSINEIKNMVVSMQTKGAQNILISMGSQGSYYFDTENNIYKIGIAKG